MNGERKYFNSINDICKTLERGSLIELHCRNFYVIDYHIEDGIHIIRVEENKIYFMECSIDDLLGTVLEIKASNFLDAINSFFAKSDFGELLINADNSSVHVWDHKAGVIGKHAMQEKISNLKLKKNSLKLKDYKEVFVFVHSAFFGSDHNISILKKRNKYYVYVRSRCLDTWFFEIPESELTELSDIVKQLIISSHNFKSNTQNWEVLDGLCWNIKFIYKGTKFKLEGYHDTPKGYNNFYCTILGYFNRLAAEYIKDYNINVYGMLL